MVNQRWKTRKGITLLGEIIALLFLIAIGYFMGGIIIFAHGASAGWGVFEPRSQNYTLDVKSGFIPVIHEDALLAFLECTYEGVQMKRILTAAITQNTSTPYIDGTKIDGTKNIEDVTAFVLRKSGWVSGERSFLMRLKTQSNEFPLIWDDVAKAAFKGDKKVLRIQGVTAKIFTPFEDGILELWISG